MSSQADRHAAENILRWRKDPIIFVREVFKAEPDEWQRDFLEKYAHGNLPRTFAKACKGPGKTTVLAWCCWHFLTCYPNPKIPCTSITADNLRNNLWAEMSKWQHTSPMLLSMFKWTATRIFAVDHPETWFMVALAWSKDATKEQQANSLAGYHADNIMFVLDEMGGIPDAVSAAAEAALANAGTEVNPNAIAKMIGAGNPTHLTGQLYRACTIEASMCNVVEITGDPDSPKRSKRINKDWARDQIRKFGLDNPWVLVNVFGKFPPASLNALIGPDEVQAAMERTVPLASYKDFAKILGVDVARHGDDASVKFPRQGIVAFKYKLMRIPDTQDLAGNVAHSLRTWEPDGCFVDATGGLGYAIVDPLQKWGYPVTPVHFSAKATDNHYFNKRSEMIWEMILWIKGGGCLPYCALLKEELCAMTYIHHKDQLRVVEKDIIKEEIGRSPDISDALALTFAYPVMKKSPIERMAESLGRGQAMQNDYDPIKMGLGGTQQQNLDDYNPLG